MAKSSLPVQRYSQAADYLVARIQGMGLPVLSTSLGQAALARIKDGTTVLDTEIVAPLFQPDLNILPGMMSQIAEAALHVALADAMDAEAQQLRQSARKVGQWAEDVLRAASPSPAVYNCAVARAASSVCRAHKSRLLSA